MTVDLRKTPRQRDGRVACRRRVTRHYLARASETADSESENDQQRLIGNNDGVNADEAVANTPDPGEQAEKKDNKDAGSEKSTNAGNDDSDGSSDSSESSNSSDSSYRAPTALRRYCEEMNRHQHTPPRTAKPAQSRVEKRIATTSVQDPKMARQQKKPKRSAKNVIATSADSATKSAQSTTGFNCVEAASHAETMSVSHNANTISRKSTPSMDASNAANGPEMSKSTSNQHCGEASARKSMDSVDGTKDNPIVFDTDESQETEEAQILSSPRERTRHEYLAQKIPEEVANPVNFNADSPRTDIVTALLPPSVDQAKKEKQLDELNTSDDCTSASNISAVDLHISPKRCDEGKSSTWECLGREKLPMTKSTTHFGYPASVSHKLRSHNRDKSGKGRAQVHMSSLTSKTPFRIEQDRRARELEMGTNVNYRASIMPKADQDSEMNPAVNGTTEPLFDLYTWRSEATGGNGCEVCKAEGRTCVVHITTHRTIESLLERSTAGHSFLTSAKQIPNRVIGPIKCDVCRKTRRGGCLPQFDVASLEYIEQAGYEL